MLTTNIRKMKVCRICCAKDVRMYSNIGTPLQDIYQNITMVPFVMESMRPTLVCYLCYARLQNCYRFKVMCLQSEQWFAQVFGNNEIQQDMLESFPKMQLTCHALINLSNIPDAEITLDVIKKEPDNSLCEELKHEDFEERALVTVTKDSKDNIKIKQEKFDHTLEYVEETQLVMNEQRKTRTANLNNGTKSKINNGKKELLYKCKKCYKDYSTKASLNRHNHLIHNNNTVKKHLECDICERKFSLKGNLMTHIRVHTDERPYKCDICKKSFTLHKNLKRHYLIHTGERPYQCNICEKRFTVEYNLKCHFRRIHTGEKPFNCDVEFCNKSFYVKSELLSHNMSIHQQNNRDIQEYKCDLCNKCLSSKSILKRHRRTHTVEKRYQCDICNKYFSRNSDLMIHYRVHTGEKFQCDICNLYFTFKSNLRKHIKKNHPYKCNKETVTNTEMETFIYLTLNE